MTNKDRDRMDLRDLNLLSDILAIYDELDPMPEMLPEVILFALQGEDIDAEMARLVESEAGLVGTRGITQVEHARRVTFSSDHLTVMIAVEPHNDVQVRLDGWAAPGAGLRVELRSGEELLVAECDDSGRFVFPAVPMGPAQLTLYPTEGSDATVAVPVVTPAVQL